MAISTNSNIDKKTIWEMVKSLEKIIDEENAVVSFQEMDDFSYFIRANEDGLRLLAKELLHASVKKLPGKSGLEPIFINDVILDADSHISLVYIHRIELSKDEYLSLIEEEENEDTEEDDDGQLKPAKLSLRRKLNVVKTIGLLLFGLFLLGLGLVSFIKWFL